MLVLDEVWWLVVCLLEFLSQMQEGRVHEAAAVGLTADAVSRGKVCISCAMTATVTGFCNVPLPMPMPTPR